MLNVNRMEEDLNSVVNTFKIPSSPELEDAEVALIEEKLTYLQHRVDNLSSIVEAKVKTEDQIQKRKDYLLAVLLLMLATLISMEFRIF